MQSPATNYFACMSPYFVPIVRARLAEKKVIDVNRFLLMLVDNACIIAGSFPLQCMLGEHYEDSDIDIFCEKNGWDSVANHIYNTYNNKGTPSVYIIDGILRSRTYVISNELRFNVIQVVCNPIDFVINTFDFSFCQTIFDGHTMYFHELTIEKIGWRLHWSLDVLKKRENYCQTTDDKYINNIVYPSNIKDYALDQNERRLQKYESRGFIIKNSESIFKINLGLF